MVSGATQVLFEGVPTYPDAGRAWDIVDKYKASLCAVFAAYHGAFTKLSSYKHLQSLSMQCELSWCNIRMRPAPLWTLVALSAHTDP